MKSSLVVRMASYGMRLLDKVDLLIRPMAWVFTFGALIVLALSLSAFAPATPRQLEKNRLLHEELLSAIQYAENYRVVNGRLPADSYKEMEAFPSKICVGYDVVFQRPDKKEFNFPAWKEELGDKNYLIRCWRGEWFEYIDAASLQSSVLPRDPSLVIPEEPPPKWDEGYFGFVFYTIGLFMLLPWVIVGGVARFKRLLRKYV